MNTIQFKKWTYKFLIILVSIVCIISFIVAIPRLKASAQTIEVAGTVVEDTYITTDKVNGVSGSNMNFADNKAFKIFRDSKNYRHTYIKTDLSSILQNNKYQENKQEGKLVFSFLVASGAENITSSSSITTKALPSQTNNGYWSADTLTWTNAKDTAEYKDIAYSKAQEVPNTFAYDKETNYATISFNVSDIESYIYTESNEYYGYFSIVMVSNISSFSGASLESETSPTINFCYDGIPEPVATEYKIKDISLSLSEDISLKYTASVPEEYKNPFIRFTFNGKESVVQGEKIEDTTYEFIFKEVTPQHLNKKITAVLCATENEQEKVADAKEYSVQEYCETLLRKTNEELSDMYGYSSEKCDAMKTLLVDFLNYGASAQEYKNEDIENLVNKNLTTEEKELASNYEQIKESEVVKQQVGTEDERISWCSAGLHFDYNVSLYYTFSLSKDVNINTVKMAVNLKDNTYYINDFQAVATSDNSIKYIAYFNSISLLDFSEKISSKIYIDEIETGKIFEYSVKSYIYSKQNQTKAEGGLSSMSILARNVYLYGQSAKLFNTL